MFTNFRIRTKILCAVLLVSLIGLGLSVYEAVQMQRIDSAYSDLVGNRDTAVVELVRAGRNVSEISYGVYRTFLYTGASAEAKAALDTIADTLKKTEVLLSGVRQAFPTFGADIDGLDKAFGDLSALSSRITALTMADQDESAKALLSRMDAVSQGFARDYGVLRDKLIAEIASERNGLSASTWSTIMLTMAGTLLGLVVGIGSALIIASKGITGPLTRLGQRMAELAGGRLDVEIDGQSRGDEIGGMAKAVQVFKDAANQNRRLEEAAKAADAAQSVQRDRQTAIEGARAEDLKAFVHAVEAGFDGLSAGDLTVRMDRAVAPEFEPIRRKFNDSVAALEDAIGSVVGSIGSIRTGLNEISVASNDLSQRTEQQAASLEETVAALAEVTRGVNDSAGNAQQAQASASTVLKNAEKGGQIVGRAVEAMGQIEQSSDKIGKIIGVIDEIAFQTNLLALNAGVEAARAGEAGRGFAVVAQEVRGLAQRSAEAAKEIKDLISASSAQVGSGVELVTATGRSLDEILTGVSDMNRVVTEIARSAREQAVSLKEVSVAADQMDKVTQQNAAMVEETTAAAQTLSTDTDELARLTETFRTSTHTSAARAPARASAKPSAAAIRRPAPTRPQAPVAQMRTAGAGGAAKKAEQDGWEEF